MVPTICTISTSLSINKALGMESRVQNREEAVLSDHSTSRHRKPVT